MDFHDFPVVLGKSGKYENHPPKLCAGRGAGDGAGGAVRAGLPARAEPDVEGPWLRSRQQLPKSARGVGAILWVRTCISTWPGSGLVPETHTQIHHQLLQAPFNTLWPCALGSWPLEFGLRCASSEKQIYYELLSTLNTMRYTATY